jgi:acyl-CoA hydrolase
VRVFFDRDETFLLEGFLSFVHVDDRGKPSPHGIVIDYTTAEDLALLEKVKTLQ